MRCAQRFFLKGKIMFSVISHWTVAVCNFRLEQHIFQSQSNKTSYEILTKVLRRVLLTASRDSHESLSERWALEACDAVAPIFNTAAGRITEALVQIGFPAARGAKIAGGIATKTINAIQKGKRFSLKNKNTTITNKGNTIEYTFGSFKPVQ